MEYIKPKHRLIQTMLRLLTMKHFFTIIIVSLGCNVAFAQVPIEQAELPGTYQISKMFLGDTLFYDIDNPAKSDKNILIEIGKYNPPIAVMEDSTLAIYLFYKDIKKALSSAITLHADGMVESTFKQNYRDRYHHISDHWEFDQKNQVLIIKSKGKTKELYPVTRVNNTIGITIEDKVEHTKIELVKLY